MRSRPKNTAIRSPIVPGRIRRIEPGGFAFIPNRFLREGFLASLTSPERSLYLLLVLAGDRNGLSYYHYDTICSLLEMPLDDYLAARDALIAKDLAAFDGTRFQVLSLPERVANSADVSSPRYERTAEGTAIRSTILASLSHDDSR